MGEQVPKEALQAFGIAEELLGNSVVGGLSLIALHGPKAHRLLDPVPGEHIERAIGESLPQLIEGLEGDERNVLLTLARMWMTAATGDIVPKDTAATWAIGQLPESLGATLDLARQAYLGEATDSCADKGDEVARLVDYMKQSIADCLGRAVG